MFIRTIVLLILNGDCLFYNSSWKKAIHTHKDTVQTTYQCSFLSVRLDSSESSILNWFPPHPPIVGLDNIIAIAALGFFTPTLAPFLESQVETLLYSLFNDWLLKWLNAFVVLLIITVQTLWAGRWPCVPMWASVLYDILLCIRKAFRHLGTYTLFVFYAYVVISINCMRDIDRCVKLIIIYRGQDILLSLDSLLLEYPIFFLDQRNSYLPKGVCVLYF